MADTIKIGNLEIDNLKVGTLSVDALYIGDVKIYPHTVAPKLTAYYSDGSVYQPSCNTSTTLTQSEVRAHTTSYTAMTSAVVGDCVTSIGQNAFRMGNYTVGGSLSSITLSNSVKTISTQAFSYNKALKTFEMPNNVTSLGSNVFYYCTSLSSVTLSQNITGISAGLFSNCGNLKSVVIPSGVTSIGQTAFYSCNNLTSLEIPNSVTTIQNRAFVSMGQSITSGASITIGSGVTSIGYGAFNQFGTSLTDATNVVTIYATTPPSMILSTGGTSNNKWGFRENTIIYVPCDSINAYKADEYWGIYASQIESIPNSCTPTLKWVSYSEGDAIPQSKVYGFKGDSQIVGNPWFSGILEIGTDSNNCVTFGHGAPTRTSQLKASQSKTPILRAPQFEAYFYLVSSGTPSYIDSWEGGLGTFIFSDYTSSGVEEYYYEDGTKTVPFDCQLYIYA